MQGSQLSLFPSQSGLVPEGFSYCPDVISADDERASMPAIALHSFKQFEFHGFEAERRVVSFGRRYDVNEHRLLPACPISVNTQNRPAVIT
jgi:hypothetical protein